MPVVTCVCVTRNRREWLPRAIECFERQTFRDAELLIVSDGEDVCDLVPVDARIRHAHVVGPRTVGAKRNLGCGMATGRYICHWDDDDWSAPERLSDQLVRSWKTACPVTGYHSMRFTDGVRWWQYKGTPGYALGTSLLYLRTYWDRHRFHAIDVEEDRRFVSDANACGMLSTADAGDLMYATIHPGNTSPRDLSGMNWKPL